MFEHYSQHFCSVVQSLADCLRTAKEDPEAPGVVFLIGAGCSMQYGLPGFRELLAGVYNNSLPKPFKEVEEWDEGRLRKSLEPKFRTWDPRRRRRAIAKTFPPVQGADCVGYLRLARLRPYIRAILNMNFDLLLEEACEAVHEPVPVFYDFKRVQGGAIYKIHGTIRDEDGKGEPIIGIDESHIFKDGKEASEVTNLLTQNHVVILGYGGGDEKILHALRSVPGADSEASPETLPNLFVVNLSGPGIRLPNIQRKRRSEALVLEGLEAGFENFMEGLEQAIKNPEEINLAVERQDGPPRILYSTQLESVAADECRKLALNVRATINVAETGRIGIIEHGEELFERCLKLAGSAGVALTSPEKYLLLCAGYLHDLGYFLGYSTDRASENPGWQLLQNHGDFTAELLEKYLNEDWRRRITPAGYSEESRRVFAECLIDLCRGHSLSVSLGDPIPEPKSVKVEIHGLQVSLRPVLIGALFSTAEELAEGHPFFPSQDPIEPDPIGDWTMEDPVLDLYLRQKARALRHEILPGRVIVQPEAGVETLTDSAAWLLTLACRSVQWLHEVVRRHGGQGLVFEGRFSTQLPLAVDNETLIRNALKENLTRMLDRICPGSMGEARSVVDLLALHSLGHPAEPRLAAKEAFGLRGARRKPTIPLLPSGGPWQNAVSLFFLGSGENPAGAMTRAFRRDFYEIIYPAWRFCARSLHTGVNAIVLSRLIFELGSTPFRAEFASALRHLASEKVKWDEAGEKAYGHDGCTLCTGRLLYIFSYARLVRRPDAPDSLPTGKQGQRRSTEEIVRALLRTFLDKESPPNWWGIKEGRPGGEIRSADYAGWAVRGLAFCLAVDQEIRNNDKEKERPLLVDRQPVIDLLAERLENLCGSTREDFINDTSEEPHTYIAGDVAITLLETERLLNLCDDVAIDLRRYMLAACETLRTVRTELDQRELPLISNLYLWPAKIFLHRWAVGDEQKELDAILLKLHRQCSDSRIWIRNTEGSWGYNEENTQRLVSAMNTFWRYAYEHRERFEPLFAQWAGKPTDTSV